MIKGKNTAILDINYLWLSFTIQHPQNKFIDKKCSQNRIKKYLFENNFESSSIPRYKVKFSRKGKTKKQVIILAN